MADLLGEPDYDASLAQWHTPHRLAARMCAEWAPLLRNAVVVEPAAGGGALVRTALDAGAQRVIACEIDPQWCWHLRRIFHDMPVTVIEGDFLQSAEDVSGDLVLSNPPYDRGMDTAFLAACVNVAPYHISLTNASALAGLARYKRVWTQTHLHAVRQLVRRPVFGGSKGSGGGTKDCVVTLSGLGSKPECAGPAFDWWPDTWKE